jgi:hypothetical protein
VSLSAGVVCVKLAVQQWQCASTWLLAAAAAAHAFNSSPCKQQHTPQITSNQFSVQAVEVACIKLVV